MGKNGASEENTINVGSFEFRRVKDGLDETQVAAIVSQLVSQRDDLSRRTEHLASLTKLAETTVAEADKIAEEIKARTQEQASAEASLIIGQARTQAERVTEDTRQFQAELAGSVRDIVGELVSVMDNLRERLGLLKVEAERRLATPLEIKEHAEETAAGDESRATDWSPAEDSGDAGTEKKPGIELEILPPLDIMKIMDIVTYLDSLPEIGNTELIPNPERPSIIVSLRKPIPLIDMLRTLPEIANVTTIETSDGETPSKVQISLSENPVTQKA